ncbi:MAG: hypothetical protein JWQ35_1785 [Bacteriovoracaceae bacterium]|nr:hypothetical protein [Bacteriovoracaceae bacterium]
MTRKLNITINFIFAFLLLGQAVAQAEENGNVSSTSPTPPKDCFNPLEKLGSISQSTEKHRRGPNRSGKEIAKTARDLIEIVPFKNAKTSGFYKVKLWSFVLQLNRQFRPLPHNFNKRENPDIVYTLDVLHPAVLIDMTRNGNTQNPVVAYSLETLHRLAKDTRNPEEILAALHSKITGVPFEQIPKETLQIFSTLKGDDYVARLRIGQDVVERGELVAQPGIASLDKVSLEKRAAVLNSSPQYDGSLIFIPVYSAPLKSESPFEIVRSNPARKSLDSLLSQSATQSAPPTQPTKPEMPPSDRNIPSSISPTLKLAEPDFISSLDLGPQWRQRAVRRSPEGPYILRNHQIIRHDRPISLRLHQL